MLYFGKRYTVTVEGTAWRPVKCEHCRVEFAYRVKRKTVGSGASPYYLDNAGAEARAARQAHEGLSRALTHATENVACPKCGKYQPEMAERLRKKHGDVWMMLGVFALVGGLGPGLMIVYEVPIPWVVFYVSAPIGAVLAALAFLVRKRKQAEFDPDADAATRARRDVSNDPDMLLRERYEELRAQAEAAGAGDQMIRIDWSARAA